MALFESDSSSDFEFEGFEVEDILRAAELVNKIGIDQAPEDEEFPDDRDWDRIDHKPVVSGCCTRTPGNKH